MKAFKEVLLQKLSSNFHNNYGIENYDENRFGPFVNKAAPISQKIKAAAKNLIRFKTKDRISTIASGIEKYEERLQRIYDKLNSSDKDLLISIVAFRLLGYKKIRLPTNNDHYWNALKTVKQLKDPNDTYDPHFMHFVLEKFDLNPIGFNIKLYFSEIGIAIDFITEQYAYKLNNKNFITAENGDTILDIGGCWGDTALYFADKAGKSGKVYSFEFIPDNIKLYHINTSLNPHLKDSIELIQNPVSDSSGLKIYYKDNGPGSSISMLPFTEQTGSSTTITIDDFVKDNDIDKIDFIKMDIEGAEPLALKGAIETIRKFRPKLAIAIYHSMEDFVNIPLWIADLNLDYELFIGHYTIHAEETICFATPKIADIDTDH